LTLLPSEILLLLCPVALFTGFIKAGIPSLGTLLTVSVALILPPRDALGITLLYLLVGDLIAVSMYWRLAHWSELKKMLLPVMAGIAVGGLLLNYLDNNSLGLTLGVVVIILVSMEPLRPKLNAWALSHPGHIRGTSGFLAGAATTIGNAAGPILSLYFLLLKLDKMAFVGTGAIFFMVVNVTKIPIFLGQGILQEQFLYSVIVTSPLVFLGAIAGKGFLKWISQTWFNRVVLGLTLLAGIWLVVRSASQMF